MVWLCRWKSCGLFPTVMSLVDSFAAKNGGVFEIGWNMSRDLLFLTTRFCEG
ncbi:hypothetical protein Bca4012_017716 [Brassica carinata]